MQVPMTVAYDSAHMKPPCSAPAVVYAYGAYGKCLDMAWAPEYQILLEQGFVIAFAHVRGGGELGRRFSHCSLLSHMHPLPFSRGHGRIPMLAGPLMTPDATTAHRPAGSTAQTSANAQVPVCPGKALLDTDVSYTSQPHVHVAAWWQKLLCICQLFSRLALLGIYLALVLQDV